MPELAAKWEAQMRDAFEHPGKDLEWDFALTAFRAMYDGERKDPDRRSGASAPGANRTG